MRSSGALRAKALSICHAANDWVSPAAARHSKNAERPQPVLNGRPAEKVPESTATDGFRQDWVGLRHVASRPTTDDR